VIIIGIWSAGVVENDWGKDSSRVVIDEVAGMCIGLLFVPVNVKWMITALLLFRFFDIVKPLYIRRLEKLPGGWGVMADDILAGIYSNIVLQVIIHL
jgi:phosphatidylglycerophosphatase A